MAEVKWIKIVTDIFDDEKIRLIETLPNHDTIIVIWFKILCVAGKSNNGGFLSLSNTIHYNDEMLAAIFNRPIQTIRLALNTFESFGMIEIIDEAVRIAKWEKHQNIEGLDRIREKTRLRVQRHRTKALENKQCNVTGNATVTLGNATDKELEEDKNNTMAIEDHFERLWKLYPNKKGKGRISDKKKKEVFLLGESFEEALTKFTREVKGKDIQFIMYGSTFWNSGYIDYLDENYEEAKKSTNVKINRNAPIRGQT